MANDDFAAQRDDLLLVLHGADAIYWHDLDGQILGANERACAMFGYRLDEFVGLASSALGSTKTHTSRLALLGHIDTERESAVADFAEIEMRRKDGTLFHASTRARRVVWQGRPVVVVVAHEIPDPKIVRAELAHQRDDLQLILDAIPAFVFYKDTANVILRVNRAVAEGIGVSSSDMVNTPTSRWYPEDADAYYADDQVVIRSRQPKLGIVERLEVASDKRWVQTDKFPQFDGQGNVVGIVVVAQDITERRRLEQELLQAQKLDSIGRLAGGMAHDFNNLLTTIFGHLELARRDLPLDAPALENLDTVRLAAVRGADLTKQLLAFARRQVIQPRQTDLNGLLADADRLLRRVLDESIELRTIPTPGPLPVLIDPGQISQVILNMALNARDAMPEGGVLTLSTGRLRLDEATGGAGRERAAGAYTVLTIRDTGHGLTDEAKEHLFEPFFTTKPVGAGTGLGLATCYGMIKQNGGYISVESEPNEGTVFQILLPLAGDRVGFQTDGDPSGAAMTVSSLPASRAKRGTVLLAEDDELLRLLMGRLLAGAGYNVLSASNGEEAEALAERHLAGLDILVTDVVMPRVSGVLLSGRLRSKRPSLRVLYMSGYDESAVIQHELTSHRVALLPKPFNAVELLGAVEALLAESR